ncbi:MAG: hypothetical protein ACRDPW_09800 [Mycobacteriales bacterium]
MSVTPAHGDNEGIVDPFDRFIVATVARLCLPLVTADRAIAFTRTVQVT